MKIKKNGTATIKKTTKIILPILTLAVLVTSCSGGSGSTQNPAVVVSSDTGIPSSDTGGTATAGGIGGAGISQGTITEPGRVTVNGVNFNADNASIMIDGNQTGISQNDLALGMIVTVQVDATGTQATEVVVTTEVIGPIDAINALNKTLIVLGRTIVVDDSTTIEDNTALPQHFASLMTGDLLEVSGWVLANGKIQATHIKLFAQAFVENITDLKLRGRITGLTETHFSIAGQTIDYSDITPAFTLEAQLLVEVKGTRGAKGSSLIATSIQAVNETLGAGENEAIEIEGVVTTFVASTVFVINGQAVLISAETVIEDGVADDIADNVRLEVEGTLIEGTLHATKLKFHGKRLKLHATVESTDTATASLTLLGTTVLINDLSELKNKRLDEGPSLVLADIIVGDRLEIRGYLSNGVITATRVERRDDATNILLQAPLKALNEPSLSLLMKTVNTEASVFKNSTKSEISSADFFLQAKAGALVKVKGLLSGTDITASEVTLED